MIRSQVLLLVAVAVLAVGCSSTSNNSSSTTTLTNGASVTTSPTTAKVPTPTTRKPTSRPAKYPSCTVGQIKLDYYGKSIRRGNDFALIRIRDLATTRCTLTGPIVAIGISSSGATDTSSLTYPVPAGIVLSPNAPLVPVTGSPAPGEVVADLSLAADYRVDPTNVTALCDRHGVTPASWRLTFPGGALTVANTTSTPTPGTVGTPGLLTCRGALSPPSPVTPEPA
jgi:hypothetical protein